MLPGDSLLPEDGAGETAGDFDSAAVWPGLAGVPAAAAPVVVGIASGGLIT